LQTQTTAKTECTSQPEKAPKNADKIETPSCDNSCQSKINETETDPAERDKISAYLSECRDKYMQDSWDNGGPIDCYYKHIIPIHNKRELSANFKGTAEEKLAFEKQLEDDYHNYEQDLSQKQDKLLAKYGKDPAFQTFTNKIWSDWLHNGSEVSYSRNQDRIFLQEFLTDKACKNGGSLTDEERDAFPQVALEERLAQTCNYETITKPYTDDFNKALKDNGISIKEEESFSLLFDQNYHFTVSGIEKTRAENIQKLINSNMGLRAALVESLSGRYGNDGNWISSEDSGSSFKDTLKEFTKFTIPLHKKHYLESTYHYKYSDTTFCGYIGQTPVFNFKDGSTVPEDQAITLNQIRKHEEQVPKYFSGFENPPIVYSGNSFHAIE
jgi:hypothetical protein